jgi:hypothetical protein
MSIRIALLVDYDPSSLIIFFNVSINIYLNVI